MNFNARNHVIDPQYLPMKFPLYPAMLWYLVLCQFNTPEWLFGVFYTIYGLFFIVYIIDMFRITFISPKAFLILKD
jgi:hypothetical protein